MSIRVLIVDDHTIFRTGLSKLLSALAGIEVVGEAANGAQAVRKVKETRAELVLMDITMPEMNGLEATRVICQEHAGIHIIMLTQHDDQEYVLQALRAGAEGYLTKHSDLAEIHEAIRSVIHGETYVSRRVSQSLVSYVRSNGNDGNDGLSVLTPRQREILQLIAEGYSTHRIAQGLNISIKTVETHRHQMMERLHISDVAGLVHFAIRKGIVPLNH